MSGEVSAGDSKEEGNSRDTSQDDHTKDSLTIQKEDLDQLTQKGPEEGENVIEILPGFDEWIVN
jgi:hypothetical protein